LTTSKHIKIKTVLARFPNISDRQIATRVKASVSYVYKIRKAVSSDTTGNNNVAVGHVAPSTGLSWESPDNTLSDGSTASYYELPSNAEELQDLISYRDMNAQIGEVFRSCYRYGIDSNSDKLRDDKKIKFYIDAEIKRLEKGNFLN
jgi:hypothetical protein